MSRCSHFQMRKTGVSRPRLRSPRSHVAGKPFKDKGLEVKSLDRSSHGIASAIWIDKLGASRGARGGGLPRERSPAHSALLPATGSTWEAGRGLATLAASLGPQASGPRMLVMSAPSGLNSRPLFFAGKDKGWGPRFRCSLPWAPHPQTGERRSQGGRGDPAGWTPAPPGLIPAQECFSSQAWPQA